MRDRERHRERERDRDRQTETETNTDTETEIETERDIDRDREKEKERICCLAATEASRPIRDGDEWEKGDRRVKPRNRRKPGQPRLPWTAARTSKC